MIASGSKASTKALMIASIALAGNVCARTHTTAQDGEQARNASVQGTQAASPPESDRPVHMPSGPQSIPFELQDNLVRIELEVNGRRQSGVLDSGAGAILIDRKVGGKLGLQEGSSAGDAAGGGPEARQLLPVTITSLVAGPLAFANVAGYAMDLDHLSSSAGFPVDVLLGAPAFKHGAVSIDYANREITFATSLPSRVA